MKKKVFVAVIFFISAVISLIPQKDQEVIAEKVEVVNIEVPVRVYYKGKPVPDLKKTDFRLYENSKLQKIHGFNVYRKKIQAQDIGLNANVQRTAYKPRFFVVIFNLSDVHTNVNSGIDYLFEKVLRKNDRLMVLMNHKFIPEKILVDLKTDKEKMKELVREDAKKSRLLLLKYQSQIDIFLRESKQRMFKYNCLHGPYDNVENCTRLFKEFLDKLLLFFKDYKRIYLFPDLNRYYTFAKYLEKTKIEKWGICFYQYEKFIKLKLDSHFRRRIQAYIGACMSDTSITGERSIWGRIVQKALNDLDKEMNISYGFPADQISKLFLKVNTTFHTIFIKSLTPLIEEDFEYKSVSTNIEKSLRKITSITGGELIGSNNLERSLEKISSKEDILYILTYVPIDNQKKDRKIKIKMKNKKYKILYDRNVYAGFFSTYLKNKDKRVPKVKIKGFDFRKKILYFNVYGFKREKTGNADAGKVGIRVRIVGKDNRSIYDQSKNLLVKKEEMNISIGFKWLERGNYYILIDVKDSLTGEEVHLSKPVTAI